MPTLNEAETALEFLRTSAHDIAELAEEAKLAEARLKNIEGVLVKGMENGKVPTTVKREYARADDRWMELATHDAKSTGALKGMEARRDVAKITISLYQTESRGKL